jgi:hypothetical protein
MILLAQSHRKVVGARLVGLGACTRAGRTKELRIGVTPELVTHNAKGACGIAEGAGDFVGGTALDEECAQCFVLAVAGMGGFGEEPAAVC